MADAPYACLWRCAAAWAVLGAAPWVLRTILCGLFIPWMSPPTPTRSRGYPMPGAAKAWCGVEVLRWVTAGYVRRLSTAAGAGSPWVSPSLVVHSSKDRLVVDLRLINRFIQPPPFKYQRLAGFLSSLLPGDHLVSWDVMHAFYHIRIHPAHRKYFRFVVDGVVYEPRVLPFGMRLSPWAWTKVIRPVVAALRLRGHKLNAYVDDLAATGRREHPSSAADAKAGRIELLALFRSLGLHVHPTKGERTGTCALPLLGLLVDTRRRLLRLPAERLGKFVDSAKRLLSAACRDGRRVPNRALQRFTGTAVSCSLAIPSARFFLRRLYDAQGGLERAGSSARLAAPWGVGASRRRRGFARLEHGAMDDLRWFANLRTEPGVGRALWQPDAGILTTDASPYGWGGYLGRLLPAAGFFTLSEQQQHINIKEVAAVRICLTAFGRDLLRRGGLLRVKVDNRVAINVINGFTSRSHALMAELRRLHVVVASLGVTLEASWLPSVASVWADALSRMRDRADYRMCDTIGARLDDLWGAPTVDMSSSAINTRCTRLFSRRRTPGREGVDAFTVDWGGAEDRWIFPPFLDASRVVDKVVADGATATVILPVWQAQDWWGDAVATAQQAYLLHEEDGLILPGNARLPAVHPKWRIAAFRFVRGGRSAPTARRAPPSPLRAAAGGLTAGPMRSRKAPPGGAFTAARWPVPAPAAPLTPLPPPSCAASPSAAAPRPRTPRAGRHSPTTAGGGDGARSPPPPRPSSTTSAGSGGGGHSRRQA